MFRVRSPPFDAVCLPIVATGCGDYSAIQPQNLRTCIHRPPVIASGSYASTSCFALSNRPAGTLSVNGITKRQRTSSARAYWPTAIPSVFRRPGTSPDSRVQALEPAASVQLSCMCCNLVVNATLSQYYRWFFPNGKEKKKRVWRFLLRFRFQARNAKTTSCGSETRRGSSGFLHLSVDMDWIRDIYSVINDAYCVY